MQSVIAILVAVIAGVISGEYINYAAAEIQNPNYSEIYIPSITIIIAGLAAVYYTNKNKGKYLVGAWWLLFIGLFLFVWHPNSSIDRLKCCTNSTNIFALYLLDKPQEISSFIDNYQQNILEKQEFKLNDLPEYGFNTFGQPSSTKGSTPGSHPPGVVLVYYWGHKMASYFNENIYLTFIGAPLLLLLMRSLLIVSAYKIGILLTNSRTRANLITLLIISSPFMYIYNTGSTDIAVAGLVSVGIYYLLKYLMCEKAVYSNLLISGTFFALGGFITFGPLGLFILSCLILVIFRRQNILIELTYYTLPFITMILLYQLYGFDYLQAMPVAINNIAINYSAGIPYFFSVLSSMDRIYLVFGFYTSLIVLIGFWKMLRLLPVWLLIALLIASLGFSSIYIWQLFPSVGMQYIMPYLGWSHYIPAIILLLSLLLYSNRRNAHEYNKADFINMLLVIAGTFIILFTVFSGKVRGEISRTSSFTYLPIIIPCAYLTLKNIKKINYQKLYLFSWIYLTTIILVIKLY